MDLDQRLKRFLGRTPDLEQALFIAPDAILRGDIALEAETSIWYGCILRADIQAIRLGWGSNLQDGVIVHLADDYGVEIGARCSVGHRALLHACRIGDECLVGMASTVMDGADIGAGSIIGAGSLVLAGFTCPPESLVLGSPARIVRSLRPPEREETIALSEKYRQVARAHAQPPPPPS